MDGTGTKALLDKLHGLDRDQRRQTYARCAGWMSVNAPAELERLINEAKEQAA
jgi:hypothetical protein